MKTAIMRADGWSQSTDLLAVTGQRDFTALTIRALTSYQREVHRDRELRVVKHPITTPQAHNFGLTVLAP